MKVLKFILFFIVILLIQYSCTINKNTDWSVSYSGDMKKPYAFSLFKEAIPYVFPEATVSKVSINSSSFLTQSNSEKSALILLANEIEFSETELWLLETWINNGNDIVLISNNFGYELSRNLKLSHKLINASNFENDKTWFTENVKEHDQSALLDSNIIINQTVLRNYGKDAVNYKTELYKVDLVTNAFSYANSDFSKNVFSKSNQIISKIDENTFTAVQFQNGQGRLILCSTPLLFSNYNLFDQKNKDYLSDFLSYTSPGIKKIYLGIGMIRIPEVDDDWGVIWENKATRMALLLAILGLLVYVLTNLRRTQSKIPIIKPLKNDSKSFVETIANLYYNKRNNRNISIKMIQHFLEWVRTQYLLNTNVLDNEFTKKLSLRSGIDINKTAYLVNQLRSVLDDTVIIDDVFLQTLHKNIQQFQKNNL